MKNSLGRHCLERFLSKAQKTTLTLCHTPRAFPLGTSGLAHVTSHILDIEQGYK